MRPHILFSRWKHREGQEGIWFVGDAALKHQQRRKGESYKALRISIFKTSFSFHLTQPSIPFLLHCFRI